MVDLGVSHIKIVFEDVDNVLLSKEDVLMIDLGEVKKEVIGWGNIKEIETVKDVTIIIKESVNRKLGVFERERLNRKLYNKDNKTVVERIKEKDNIVRIKFYSGETSVRSYEVSWGGECAQHNEDVKYDVNNDGDLMVTVSKEGKVKEEYINLFHNKEYLDYLKGV